MFHKLGQFVSRFGVILFTLWIVALGALIAVSPSWDSVVMDGEFRYLPDDVASRQGEKLFKKAFSRDLLSSTIVLVIRRLSNEEGLNDQDRQFIEKVLKKRLVEIIENEGGFAKEGENSQSVVSRIRTPNDKYVGNLLISEDKKAALVVLELITEFNEHRNRGIIQKIQDLVSKKGALFQEGLIPPGLDIALSGTATVGRDMHMAEQESADATHLWTFLLVIILLVAIYRSPILAFIPLLTVIISVKISLCLLSLLSLSGHVELFKGIEVYVTVVLYGAGIDYCVFLMARYKEELDSGATINEAIANSVGKVGPALAASAGTTMCGIGMMVFAEFGKFQQAGIAMTFSLVFVLLAALTFAPALLRLAGKWAFWPYMKSERIKQESGWISPTRFIARMTQKDGFFSIWDKLSELLLAKPLAIWLLCIAIMTPFAIFGVMNFNFLSYGLLKELPQNQPSVVGAEAVQKHFPAGTTGPVSILLKNDQIDFTEKPFELGAFDEDEEGSDEETEEENFEEEDDIEFEDPKSFLEKFTDALYSRIDELGISDIRSLNHPLGRSPSIVKKLEKEKTGIVSIRVRKKREREAYISDTGGMEKHVARIDVIFKEDPFSRNSIERFDLLKIAVLECVPKEIAENTEVFYIGATPSIRDLKQITRQDQTRINILVIISVYLVLVLLLRKARICSYLILSVYFSYLVTLGFTFTVFWLLDPAGFTGLDWKVPMFLFTILIAVGEDYNIYLITRIEEEQRIHGKVKGITVALSKTGKIISSCGLIMAGTFSSLMAGSLSGMNQLGFALAFGVLLDTFVVRPILVPAYLILLNRGKFGIFGTLLGAELEQAETEESSPA